MSWLSRLFGARASGSLPGASTHRTAELSLYTRDGCHLCDQMKATIASAGLGERIRLTEVDIAADPELEAAYGRSIPVLAIDGRVAFKGRLTVEELLDKLERYAREASAGRRGVAAEPDGVHGGGR